MSDQTVVGKILDKPCSRDAIHIAVAPVIANDYLNPGEHIGFVEEGNIELVDVKIKSIGIVDPFLEHSVIPGERFWMFLYPNTITSLRHVWSHNDFKTKVKE